MNERQGAALRGFAAIVLCYVAIAICGLLVLGVPGCVNPAPAQWGTARCTPVGSAGPYAYAPQREWRRLPQDPDRWYLFVGGCQVGGFCTAQRIYRELDANGWSDPKDPPSDLPASAKRCAKQCPCGCNSGGNCLCNGVETPVPKAKAKLIDEKKPSIDQEAPYNGGLIQARLNGRERHLVNGLEATRREAVRHIESVPEFGTKQRVVVIDADEARRKRVRTELAGLPECADCVVQAYSPDHWHLKDLQTKQPGFHTGGTPTVYLLAADGKVLHRQDDFEGGAAAVAEAFRRARSDYDPRKDPDKRKPIPEPPPPSPQPPFNSVPLWLIVVVAIGFLYLWRKSS